MKITRNDGEQWFEVPVKLKDVFKWTKGELHINAPVKEEDHVDIEITFQYNKESDDAIIVQFFDYTNKCTHKYCFVEDGDKTMCFYSKLKHGYFTRFSSPKEIPV